MEITSGKTRRESLVQLSATAGAAKTGVSAASATANPQILARSVTCFLPCDLDSGFVKDDTPPKAGQDRPTNRFNQQSSAQPGRPERVSAKVGNPPRADSQRGYQASDGSLKGLSRARVYLIGTNRHLLAGSRREVVKHVYSNAATPAMRKRNVSGQLESVLAISLRPVKRAPIGRMQHKAGLTAHRGYQVMTKPIIPKTMAWKAVALAAGLALGVLSYPVCAVPASGGAVQNPTVADQSSVVVENGEKSASITLARTAGGITQIAVARPGFFSKAYVTMVTASGPTVEDAAMAVAVLQTFTNLNQQALFAGTDSITLAYNQTKPSYVISELERAKLISPLEAQAARTAFDTLQ